MARFVSNLLSVGILLFGSTQVRAADMGTQIKLKPMAGTEVAKLFAAHCQDDTFKKFVTWAKANDFMRKTASVPDMNVTRRGSSIIFASGVEINVRAHDKIELKGSGKKFVGTDLCDLFVKTAAGGKMANTDAFSLFPRAWAQEAVPNRIPSPFPANYFGLIDYISTTSNLITEIAAAKASAKEKDTVLAGLASWLKSQELNDEEEAFYNVFKNEVSVECHNETFTKITGSGFNIQVQKELAGNYKVNMVNPVTKQFSVTSLDAEGTTGAYIAAKIASKCTGPTAQIEINDSLNRDRQAAFKRLQSLETTASKSTAPATKKQSR